MHQQIEMVREFHEVYKHPIANAPHIDVSPALQEARIAFIDEENKELKEAMATNNVVEVADALTDMLYFIIGTAHVYGIADKLEACFAEVHRSNMSKLGTDGQPIYGEHNKVMKGPNYFKPNLGFIVVGTHPHFPELVKVGRAVGNSTRLANAYIEKILVGEEVEVFDHHSEPRSHLDLAHSICRKLNEQHGIKTRNIKRNPRNPRLIRIVK